MIDREKVMKGLECCSRGFDKCESCPYHEKNAGGCVTKGLAPDALELLKHDEHTIKSLERTINKLTKALAEQPEQKHGHWILWENQRREEVENGNFYYLCSQCNRGDVHAKTQDVPYCWWCGAKMDEEVKQDG